MGGRVNPPRRTAGCPTLVRRFCGQGGKPCYANASGSRHQLRELRQIDVAPAHHADNLSRAAFPAEPGGYGTSARAFGDHVVPLGHEFHGLTDLLERRDDRAGQQMMRQRPHPRKDRLAAASVHPTRLPVGKILRRSRRQRPRQRRRRLRFCREHLHVLPTLFHGSSNAARQASTAECRYHAIHVRQVFQDLQPNRSIARDEFVVFEGMHKRSVHRWMSAFCQSSPAFVERSP